MQTRWKIGALALAALIATGATMVACSDDSTAPRTAMYVANMSSANEVPAVAGNASGTATFTLSGRMLSYVVTVNGLSGTAVASHIHIGAANANGNIVFPFSAAAVQSGQVASGTVDLTQPVSNGTTSISGDSLLTLLNSGLLYTNVHTGNNAGGEVRGQITRVQSSSNGY
jgi:Cu/Zn superoxide dismutase